MAAIGLPGTPRANPMLATIGMAIGLVKFTPAPPWIKLGCCIMATEVGSAGGRPCMAAGIVDATAATLLCGARGGCPAPGGRPFDIAAPGIACVEIIGTMFIMWDAEDCGI